MDGRRNTGKLRRPQRHGRPTALSNLRRLQGAGIGLADPYDARHLADDPPILAKPQDQPQGYSPLRKDRKRRRNARPEEEEADASSQPVERRATRSQLSMPGDEGDRLTPQVTPRRSSRNLSPSEEPSTSTPLKRNRSPAERGSDRREVRNYEVVNDDHHVPDNDSGDDSDAMTQAANAQLTVQSPNTSEKRSPGRPPKSRPSDAHSPSSTEKRGPGRPPKARASSVQTPTSTEKRRHGRPSKVSPAGVELTADEDSTAIETAAVSHLSGSGQRSLNPPQENAATADKVRPLQVRVSTVHFDDDRNNLEDSVLDGQDAADAAQERPRKRKAVAGSQNHPTRAEKRAKPVDNPMSALRASDVEEEPGGSDEGQHSQQPLHDETEENTDKRRLFGQGWKLEHVVSMLGEVGVSYQNGNRIRANIDRDDQNVRALRSLCNRATESLTQLRDDEEGEAKADPPQEFDLIKLRVQRLCGRDKDHPTDLTNSDKAAEIYFHAIPRLVKLLDHTVRVYEEMDGKASITIEHHKAIIDLIEVILDMGNGAGLYESPKGLAVVKPVKNEIIPPLRNVKDALSKSLRRREQAQIMARCHALQAELDARQEEQEALEREEREREERLRRLWMQLHDERRHVEGMVPLAKSIHLRIPDATIEVDQNGESFERLPVFRRRIGPHPAHIAKVRKHVWGNRQIMALMEGLRSKSGPGVFRDIFREHCVRGAVLNEFNVTEIVTIAADLKEHLEEQQMEDQGYVEDWVKAIPMWTNAHALLGQENAI